MKKRIVSMLLALTLVVSGMPVGITADGVNAAEVLESSVSVVDETEETESAVESNDMYEEALHPEAGDLYTFHVSKDGKAVGSDGIAYDDVVYLSADTVEALDVEGQNAYVEICDRIAEEENAGDYLQSVVIAVDEDGNLIVQRKVSMKLLQTLMGELTENVFEDEAGNDEDQIAEETEELSTQENEKEVDNDDSLDEEGLHNADSDEANGNDEADAEEVEEASKVEATVEEDPVEKEEPSTEEVMTDDVMTDDVMTDGVTTDNVETEEALTEDASVEDEELSTEEALADNAAAEETEVATEEPVLSAENMELIDELEAEEFEVVENAKADLIVDLGYTKTGDMQQFNSLFPKKNYFYDQLTESEKKIYDASKVLGTGKNKFTLKPSTMPPSEDIYRGMSAYMITEPYKCDWLDTTGQFEIIDYDLVVKDASGNVISRKYDHTDVKLPKSKFYTSKIQKAANDKVLELAAEAQAYAIKYYPDAPVYGIVKYFDKWICENHYYNLTYGTLASSDYVIDTKTNTVKIELPESKQLPYYYCHSSYGVLLEDYGVCESYALAMTRLLDAVGIPNIYATGDALDKNGQLAGGHAWNYVGMPDGKWYLQDSTWDEVDIDTPDKINSPSTEDYLLCADDTNQPYGRIPDGNRFTGLKPFTFEERSSSKYEYTSGTEKIILSLKGTSEPTEELNLLAKKTKELTYDNGQNAYIMNEDIPKVWASSNEKIAKVDKNGKVTAVAPGSAEITLTAAGITATCKVNVHQINSITFDEGGKASLTTSCGIVSSNNTKETQQISLTVNQKAENPVYTAEQLNAKGVFDDFAVKSLDESVVKVSSITIENNKINFDITPEKVGKTKIEVIFGAKKATLTVSVGEMLDENWFDLKEVKDLQAAGDEGTLMYTGKALKPKVTLSSEGKAGKVKFKASYLNNKDAGTASVIITGTGTYGGKLRYDITINPLVLNVDKASVKVTEESLYNGGVNLTKSTVKHIDNSGKKVSLKAGKDYDIIYTNIDTKEVTREPSKVGTYSMEIVGKGNYVGTIKEEGKNESILPTEVIESKTWTIKPIDIKKVKVTVKVNGRTPDVTVAIGKNVLSENTSVKDGDYKLTFYKDKECIKEPVEVFAAKSQYYVKIEGGVSSNLTNVKPIIKSFKTK